MGEDRSSESRRGRGRRGRARNDQERASRRGRRGRRSARTPRPSVEEAESSGEEMSDTDAEAAEALSAEMSDDAEMGDAEAPPSRGARAAIGSNEPRGPDYQVFTAQVRRGGARPRTCASPRSSTGCAAISTSSSSHLQGVVARLANRLQRRLMAQQNRAWEFDLEEGMLDAGAPVAHHHRSDASALLQAREGHRTSATRW